MSEMDTRSFLMKIQKNKNKKSDSGIDTSLLEDRKNVLDLNILVCVDVSGSISNWQFQQFMKQIDAIRGLSRVKVIEIDTEIVAMYDYFKVDKKEIVRCGGTGGTEFSPAFKKAREIEPDAVLFMTDGEVYNNINNPGIPTGWILTADGRKPYDWGEVLKHLKDENNNSKGPTLKM